MALVLGTNCGFVSVAPTSDPSGGSSWTFDEAARAGKFTTPAEATKIIEIGWWCGTGTSSRDMDLGIYDHDSGNDKPKDIVGVTRDNPLGGGAGWKKVDGLNITVSPSTIYWIGVQIDGPATGTGLDYTNDGGEKLSYSPAGTTALQDPWVEQGSLGRLGAIYALYETAVGFTRKIKISGTFQDKPIKTKVGGTFVDKPIKIKVGGTFQDA